MSKRIKGIQVLLASQDFIRKSVRKPLEYPTRTPHRVHGYPQRPKC